MIKQGFWTVNHGCLDGLPESSPCFQNVGMNGKHPLRDELTPIRSLMDALAPGVLDTCSAMNKGHWLLKVGDFFRGFGCTEQILSGLGRLRVPPREGVVV